MSNRQKFHKSRQKFYKSLYFYVRKLRYRRLEGWPDDSEPSAHFIVMINKFCAALWPRAYDGQVPKRDFKPENFFLGMLFDDDYDPENDPCLKAGRIASNPSYFRHYYKVSNADREHWRRHGSRKKKDSS